MADKEERQKRLLIREYDLVCDLTDCKDCEEKDWCSEKDVISRSEVVDRMAKVLCQWDTETNDCTECCNENNKNACRCILTDEGYIARAEAELDALLGWKK